MLDVLVLHQEKNPKVSLKFMNVATCVRFDKFGAILTKFSAKTFSIMNKNARVINEKYFPCKKTHEV